MGATDDKQVQLTLEIAPSVDDDDPYIGHTFGERYEIVSKLGEGSQARVYLAKHVLIERLVAVKFLLPILASDKSLVARFLDEGRAAGRLGHPNIVESLDMGFAPDGAPYLVLELLEGRTLAEEIAAADALPASRAAYIGSQIASALSAAHARDIVHRDLKPANVLLIERSGRPDHVKVLDFGISKFTAGTSRVTTIKGQALGTPGFMAPEQIEDPENIDSRADVYGLGATLYEMLAGEAPFADVAFPKILRLIVEEEPRKLAEIRPDLPVGLVNAVERAMHKSRAARFQTMVEFEDALLAFAHEPSRFRSVDPKWSAPSLAAPPPSRVPRSAGSVPRRDAAESIPVLPPPRRKRKIAAVALLLLLGAIAVILALVLLRDREPSEARTGEPPPKRTSEASVSNEPVALATEPVAPSARVALPPPVARATPKSQSRKAAPVAASGPAQSSPQEGPNCDPPFYFEGKKKLFKPGCI